MSTDKTAGLVPHLAPFTQSVFGEMSLLASKLDAINLGQGFPDTDGPDELKQLAMRAIAEGKGNQYPPAHGLPALREAIANHQQRFYGLQIDWQTGVVVATGASEALQATFLGLIHPGDEVLIFEPWFDIYEVGVAMAHGKTVGVPSGHNMRPDFDRLRAAVSERSRAIVLNTPHNPTGIVWTAAELQKLADIAIEHDLIVISDEAYEHLWFDGHPHVPIAMLPGMFDRTVTIGSAGKSFSFTGWKVGWATGPAHLIHAVRTARQHLSYVSGGPFQVAIAEGLAFPDSYWEAFRHDLQAKRDFFTAGITSLGFALIASAGTYFLTTDVRPLGFESGLQFCEHIPHAVGVVAIPLSKLCQHPEVGAPYVRWAFCKQMSVLEQALERLSRL